jgi:hypothetical protein
MIFALEMTKNGGKSGSAHADNPDVKHIFKLGKPFR